MISLEAFLSSRLPDVKLIETDSDFYADGQAYIDLLHNSKIERNSSKPPPIIIMDGNIPYSSAIDEMIRYLLIKKQSNVLTNGYQLDMISSQVVCKDSNFQADFMKNDLWHLVYTRIGPEVFFDMLFNCSCFINLGNDNQLQIFGPGTKRKFVALDKEQYINKNLMLFQNSKSIQNLQPIPSKVHQFLGEIFSNVTFHPKKRIPKKYRQIGELCQKIIDREEKSRSQYYVESICPTHKVGDFKSNLEYATPKRDVIKFAIVSLSDIFPDEAWGSSKNKLAIIDKVVDYINGDKNEKFKVSTLLTNIKVKEVEWLGKNSENNLSKQDFIKRESFLCSFVTWILKKFLPKFIGAYFHVTTSSLASGLLYFRQETWNRITSSFKENYFDTFLEKNTYAKNDDEDKLSKAQLEAIERKITKNHPYQGRLRLTPKKDDFRPICLPIRNPGEDKFVQINHLNHKIKPTREVLRRLRMELPHKHPRCSSIASICENIKLLKERVQSLYGELPELFFIKFDIKQCYDTIPKDKVLEISYKLLEGEKKSFLYKPLNIMSVSRENANTGSMLIDSENLHQLNIIENGLDNKFQNRIVVDTVKTSSIANHEILDVIEKQLNRSALRYGEKTLFSRKDGIFQGLPLSATFCDVVYDDLVDKHFDLIDPTHSMVLRLADDFLIISPFKKICEEVFQNLSKGFPDYTALINNVKTTINFDDEDSQNSPRMKNIVFCGLTIDVETLSVTKTYDPTTASVPSQFKSYKALYSHLYWLYQVRLTDSLVDNEFNETESVLQNVYNISESIAHILCVSSKRLSISDFSHEGFKSFVLKIYAYTTHKIKNSNGILTPEGYSLIIMYCKNGLISKLKGKPQYDIQWLQDS